MEKSKESVSRGPQRIIIREDWRTYKDDVANFSSSTSIYYENAVKYYKNNYRN
nr:palindromic element RPE5 domain-containing protein [Rickettsia asiatica]